LAALGYTVLTFDFTGWGASEGSPRQLEMPRRKIDDIVAASRFMSTLSCVAAGGIGYLAICASSMYVAPAIECGAPIAALACIAGWFHDTASVAAFYGGAPGVSARIARARAARRLSEGGEGSTIVPAYEEGNERAGMSLRMDYYAKAARGRIPAWTNEMAEETWLYWLSFDGLRSAERSKTPTLFVHGDECALPQNVRRIHDRMPGPKQLVWHPGFQVDFYDRPDLVDMSITAADSHFQRYLRTSEANPTGIDDPAARSGAW
jgi:hypothetical protein